MPPENLFFLAFIVIAFGAFALALAYGSTVAGGNETKSQASQKPEQR